MQAFALYCSLRYLTWGSVAAAKAHVIEWHAATLGIMAPLMPKTAYVLAKLKKTLVSKQQGDRSIRRIAPVVKH
eukprot:COSAG06_NODE_5422_length_3492_cov_2.015915_1_plen_74_part_00